MAKTETKRRKTRSSKVVSDAAAEEECNTEEQSETTCSSEQSVVIEDDAPSQSTETKQEEKQDEEDPQMDCVIEVKGNTQTVAVSWEKQEIEEEGGDSEKTSDSNDQTTDKGEQTPEVSSADATENVASEEVEVKEGKENGKADDNAESQMETAAAETESGTKEPEEEQSSSVQQETNGVEEKVVEEKKGKKNKKKRKAQAEAPQPSEPCEPSEASEPSEPSPAKKTRTEDSGFCVFIGNLNQTKKNTEIKSSLATYLASHSLLIQDIRVGRSKKYAHVDLASEMDLTKALTLEGEMFLDKPLRVAKAMAKVTDKPKISPEEKKATKDAKRLFVKNIPLTATVADIQKVFQNARKITFCNRGGSAFVEFKSPTAAQNVHKRKQGAKVLGQVVVVNLAGQTDENKEEVKDETSDTNDAPSAPSSTLFVTNVPFNVTEKSLKKLFPAAVNIKIPSNDPKPKGYVFVEFASVDDAEKALKETENKTIKKRTIGVQFYEHRERPPVSYKTLVVKRLSEKTTAETLKSAFEGASSARVILNKGTGESKRFGFVEFESEEECKAVKKSMWDCEIDGCRVIVSFAKERNEPMKKEDSSPCPDEQPANPKAGKGRRKGKGRKLEDVPPEVATKKVKKAKG